METKNFLQTLIASEAEKNSQMPASTEAENSLQISSTSETETLLGEIFTVKTANEWLRESKPRPVPKMLFGEFWLEGELAIMFGDTGKGKSILAVQIAEAIARGHGIEPMGNTAPAKQVLYLDFELTAKQFEMRYSADPDPAIKATRLRNTTSSRRISTA